jgi:hypothetical protein
MVKLLISLMLWAAMPLCGADNDTSEKWTWVYRKNFDERSGKALEKNQKLMFEQEEAFLFTQLIFSWNALRPLQGHFSFYVQVRDAVTKQWGVWHHMFDWGCGIQQSFPSKSDGFSSYIHTRLETKDKKNADAFRIKIEAQRSSSLVLVRSLSVALSNLNLFKPEPHHAIDQKLLSVLLPDVPSIAQFA